MTILNLENLQDKNPPQAVFQEWMQNVIEVTDDEISLFYPVLRGNYPNTLQIFTKKDFKNTYYLSTHNYCGFWQFSYQDTQINIEVRPKVLENNQMEWKSLLPLLYESEVFPNLQGSALLLIPEDNIGHFWVYILKAFHRCLKELFRLGLRSQQKYHQQTLIGKRKGQLHISSYIQNVAQGKFLHFPCSYSTLLINTPLNQMVKSGLIKALQLCQNTDFPNNFQDRVQDLVSDLKIFHYHLHMIDSVHIQNLNMPYLRRTLSKTVVSQPYHDVFRLVEFLQQDKKIQEQSGQTKSFGISFHMPMVFERALGNLLKKKLKTETIQTNSLWRYSKNKKKMSRSMKPDIICTSQSWVMDAKWKKLDDFHQDDPEEDTPYSVNRNDLFQIISYCSILRNKTQKETWGFLVYPSNKNEEDCTAEILSIDIDGENIPLHIAILPWKIYDRTNREYTGKKGIEKLIEEIQKCRGQKSTDLTQKNADNL